MTFCVTQLLLFFILIISKADPVTLKKKKKVNGNPVNGRFKRLSKPEEKHGQGPLLHVIVAMSCVTKSNTRRSRVRSGREDSVWPQRSVATGENWVMCQKTPASGVRFYKDNYVIKG